MDRKQCGSGDLKDSDSRLGSICVLSALQRKAEQFFGISKDLRQIKMNLHPESTNGMLVLQCWDYLVPPESLIYTGVHVKVLARYS